MKFLKQHLEELLSNLKKNNIRSINDIHAQDRLIVDFSDKIKKLDKQIKDFLKHNMYNHKKVITNTNKAKIIINDLFMYLLKNSKKQDTVRSVSKQKIL